MKTTVSFPGIGIGEFTLDRVAFEIFGKPIYWYGIIITCGILIAFLHAYLRTKQEGIIADDILDVGLWTVLCGVVGARLYYVLFDFLERPKNYQSFVDVIAIWNGGLAIYGGIIGGTLAILGVSLFKKINPLKVMDTIAPGVMIAQAIGRWGNFFNGEAHGGVVSEGSPLYFLRMGLFEDGRMQYFHPTFLYESLWNIVGFTLITIFYRKKKFNGQVTLAYFAWYGFGRMFIEGLRTDSLYWGPFRVSQVLGGICFAVGAGLMIACLIFRKKGMFDKFLTVKWAEPAVAGGVPVEATPAESAKPETPDESPKPERDTPDTENPDTESQGD